MERDTPRYLHEKWTSWPGKSGSMSPICSFVHRMGVETRCHGERAEDCQVHSLNTSLNAVHVIDELKNNEEVFGLC
jgi:hypothetical protein